jgi:hypothetical protein
VFDPTFDARPSISIPRECLGAAIVADREVVMRSWVEDATRTFGHAGEGAVVDYRARTPLGFSIALLHGGDEEPTGFTAWLRDVTAPHQHNRELHQQLAALEAKQALEVFR